MTKLSCSDRTITLTLKVAFVILTNSVDQTDISLSFSRIETVQIIGCTLELNLLRIAFVNHKSIVVLAVARNAPLLLDIT